MRRLILACLTLLLVTSADAQVGGSPQLEGERGGQTMQPTTRRAMLGHGALGLGAGLALSAGLGALVGRGTFIEARHSDELPGLAGVGVGLGVFMFAAPVLTGLGLDRAGRAAGLRGGLGPAFGASFATLLVGGVVTAGLLLRVAERPAALAVMVAVPAVTLASSVGLAYLAYRHRDRRERERERAVDEHLSLSARPMLGRNHIGLTATGRF